MLEEVLKVTKADISEALKSIGYKLVGSFVVNELDGENLITLSIKKVRREKDE